MPSRVGLGTEGGWEEKPGKECGEMGLERVSAEMCFQPALQGSPGPPGLGGRGPGVSLLCGMRLGQDKGGGGGKC